MSNLIGCGVSYEAHIDRVTDQLADQGLARKRCDGSRYQSKSMEASHAR